MRSARASPFETPARSQVYAGCACYGGLLRVRIEVVPGHHPHYIDRAGLHGSSGAIFSGPYRSLRELSLAGPWAGYMAPTYFRREPGIDAPTAIAAPHFVCPGQSAMLDYARRAPFRRLVRQSVNGTTAS